MVAAILPMSWHIDTWCIWIIAAFFVLPRLRYTIKPNRSLQNISGTLDVFFAGDGAPKWAGWQVKSQHPKSLNPRSDRSCHVSGCCFRVLSCGDSLKSKVKGMSSTDIAAGSYRKHLQKKQHQLFQCRGWPTRPARASQPVHLNDCWRNDAAACRWRSAILCLVWRSGIGTPKHRNGYGVSILKFVILDH